MSQARMFLYPAFDAGMLLGCVVVDDEAQVELPKGSGDLPGAGI